MLKNPILMFVIFLIVYQNPLYSQDKKTDSAFNESIEESDNFVPPPSFNCDVKLTLKDCIKQLCNIKIENTENYKIIMYETENCFAVGIFSDSLKVPPNAKYYSLNKKEFDKLDFLDVVKKIREEFINYSKLDEFKMTSIGKHKKVNLKFDDGKHLIIEP